MFEAAADASRLQQGTAPLAAVASDGASTTSTRQAQPCGGRRHAVPCVAMEAVVGCSGLGTVQVLTPSKHTTAYAAVVHVISSERPKKCAATFGGLLCRSLPAARAARSKLSSGTTLGGNRELVLLGTPAVRSDDVRRPTLQPRDLGRVLAPRLAHNDNPLGCRQGRPRDRDTPRNEGCPGRQPGTMHDSRTAYRLAASPARSALSAFGTVRRSIVVGRSVGGQHAAALQHLEH
jgi:hypothetical protein